MTKGASDERPAVARKVSGEGRERTCILTRKALPEADLIRFVAGPDASLVPDLKARLPGRGAWVLLSRQAVAEAVRRNLFARALKAPVAAPPEFTERVGRLLREAALGRLGLARKAGEVIVGFAKVEAAIAKGSAAAVIAASDGAADGRRKIAAACTRHRGNGPAVPLIEAFSASELGLALGRANVIHAAVLHGAAAKGFSGAAERLRRYEQDFDMENKGLHRKTGQAPERTNE